MTHTSYQAGPPKMPLGSEPSSFYGHTAAALCPRARLPLSYSCADTKGKLHYSAGMKVFLDILLSVISRSKYLLYRNPQNMDTRKKALVT